MALVVKIPSNPQGPLSTRAHTAGQRNTPLAPPRPRELERHGPHRCGPSRGTICALRLRSQPLLLHVVAETCLARILVWFR